MSEIKVSSVAVKKNVGTPSDEYESMLNLWAKCRSVIRGQDACKAHDEYVNDYDDKGVSKNLLLPFSPSMSQNQYDFFKAEAELPNITSQYAKSMVGALLRKDASLVITDRLGEKFQKDVNDWLRYELTADNRSMFHFLDNALWEEIQTGYCWIYADLPSVNETEYEVMTEEQKKTVKPYPVTLTAEQVINVIYGKHPITKAPAMLRFITRYFTNVFSEENPWHPERVDTVRDHFLDNEGKLVVKEYHSKKQTVDISIKGGQVFNEELTDSSFGKEAYSFILEKEFKPTRFGERLNTIPAWPLDGEYELEDPLLLNFVNREIGLYNKVSRRNHLMYGAATYTPIITGVEDEDKQLEIVRSGLGSWIFLDTGATAETLAPPTEALADMQTAIEATISEMARLGIRMLSPETVQSGTALEVRSNVQTALLGTLNMKVSTTLRSVFTFLINWRYDTDLTTNEVEFNMSSDFSPQSQGEEAMRLIGEWYQSGLIPRSIFIEAAKSNDYIPADYNDKSGVEELEKDPVRQMAMESQSPTIQE